MHQSSIDKVGFFVDQYLTTPGLKVLDVGSCIVSQQEGHLKPLFKNHKYTGLDIEPGLNVDIAVADPYSWREVPDNTYDVVVSSQAFEHIRFPWITIKEVARVLKPGGLAMIVAPAGGPEHKYPYDCWRYYPDAWGALCESADLEPLEIYTQWRNLYYTDGSNKWLDSCVIAKKGGDARAKTAMPDYEKALIKQRGLYPWKGKRKTAFLHFRQGLKELFSLNR